MCHLTVSVSHVFGSDFVGWFWLRCSQEILGESHRCSIQRFDWGWCIHFEKALSPGSCLGPAVPHQLWVWVLISLPSGPVHWGAQCAHNMQGSDLWEQGGSPSAFYVSLWSPLTIASALLCSLEASHSLQPTHKGRGIKFCLLRGGLSKDLWTCLKTTTPGVVVERWDSQGPLQI